MNDIAKLPSQPKISVVTVSFNQGEFIRQNIESVLAQNYPNFEHLIIDGGSTDGTLDVLRGYPHLCWTSEKDRNQCDALNKGFRRATGDIVAWLNSDDWYASGAFGTVIEALRDYPIVLTPAVETDRQGIPRQTIENTPRDFFDVMRYWVPKAWLAQTGVFFRRDLLEAVKLPNGDYVDETFNYAMDMDLWVRMARHFPFSRRAGKVCAYFRIYEENKTGKNPLSTQIECGRVFRRYLHAYSEAERELTFVLPIKKFTGGVGKTLQSLAYQKARNFDLLLVDAVEQEWETLAIKDTLHHLEENVNVFAARRVPAGNVPLLDAASSGIRESHSPLVALIYPGDTVSADFSTEAVNALGLDPTGLAIPVKHRPELEAALSNEKTNRIRHEAMLSGILLTPHFVLKKLAFEELGQFRYSSIPQLALRYRILQMVAHGWHINTYSELSLETSLENYEEQQGQYQLLHDFITAQLILDIHQELSADPFAPVRREGEWSLPISPAFEQTAREILEFAPPNWWELNWMRDISTLEETTGKYPNFAPAWFLLEAEYKRIGDVVRAEGVRQIYLKLTKIG